MIFSFWPKPVLEWMNQAMMNITIITTAISEMKLVR